MSYATKRSMMPVYSPIYEPILHTEEIHGEPSTPEGQYRHKQGYQSEDREASTPEEQYLASLGELQTVAKYWHGGPDDIDAYIRTIPGIYQFVQTSVNYRQGGSFLLFRWCPTCRARPLFPCHNMTSDPRRRDYRAPIAHPHPARRRGEVMTE